MPVLAKQDSDEALWNPEDAWEAITSYRKYDGAQKAVLAFGAPAFLAGQAVEKSKEPVDVYIVNGLPLPDAALDELIAKYPAGIVTVEDGIIATPALGLRGFASLVVSVNQGRVPLGHVGITDPSIAPSHGFDEVWEHFGITEAALSDALNAL